MALLVFSPYFTFSVRLILYCVTFAYPIFAFLIMYRSKSDPEKTHLRISQYDKEWIEENSFTKDDLEINNEN